MSPRTKAQSAAARETAREAWTSFGLAYHYFRSTDALFVELAQRAYEGGIDAGDRRGAVTCFLASCPSRAP